MLDLMVAGSATFCNQIMNRMEPYVGKRGSVMFDYTNDLDEASIVIAEEGACKKDADVYVFIEVKKAKDGSFFAEQYIKGEKLESFPIECLPSMIHAMVHMVDLIMSREKDNYRTKAAMEALDREKKESGKALQTFHNIQRTVYEDAENMEGYDTCMMFFPYQKVSGDFLVTKKVGGKSFVVIGDITKHGYYAAAYAASVVSAVKGYFDTCSLFSANIENLCMYMSDAAYYFHGNQNDSSGECVLCEIDHGENKARFCTFSGGNISPILICPSAKKEKNKVRIAFPEDKIQDGSILTRLGDPIKEKKAPFVFEENFYPGDAILFYTDGFSELFSKEEIKDQKYEYGVENMQRVVMDAFSLHGNAPEDLVRAVTQDVASYGTRGIRGDASFEGKLSDDAMIFCIRRK